MEGDPHDTVIDFEEPVQQSPEVLAKQRRAFIWLRWVLRLTGGCVVVIMVLLSISLLNGESGPNWYMLPLPPILIWLLYCLERARFCPDCDAMYGLPAWKQIAFCPNCHRLLDPTRVLLDPPGMLDLTKEEYLSEAEPVLKLIAMVILLGIKDRSTEIRFEPGREEFRVRYRCDGVLYDMVPPPMFLREAACGTLKAMAGLDLERRPQTVTLQIKRNHVRIDARVECHPTEFGENVIVWLGELHDIRIEASGETSS